MADIKVTMKRKLVVIYEMATSHLKLVEKVSGTIPQYFSGKNIFITGFTGFLGKFLVQKLLTDCPDVGRIYVLVRESRNKTIAEKVRHTFDNPLFNHLREKISVLDKIVPIEGDICQLNLGISDTSRQELIDNVNIIYHCAATVRFDMALKDAIILNVRGTREVCALALDMKNCDGFMHVSTAYCQLRQEVVEEKLYPSPVNWKEAIQLAEKMDKFELSIICEKYMQDYPNTYTFTKAIAESVVSDMCTAKIQTVIFRPTIVTAANKGPIPGWIDNFNGPTGLSIAWAKGILRTAYAGENAKYDIIPIDFVINYMLKAIWMQQYLSPTEVSVYNCSAFDIANMRARDMEKLWFEAGENVPLNPIWHVQASFTDSMTVYFLNTFLFHFLPGCIIDFFLGIFGKPINFVKLQRRVYITTLAGQYFLRNSWKFINYKCFEMDNYVLESDEETFYKVDMVDITKQMELTILYVKVHMLKESHEKEECEMYKKKRIILAVLHLSIKYVTIFMILCWSWNRILVPVLDNWLDYWENL